jgi:anti-sigma regulatory factor (Ser/Thr protein kinase)
MARKDRYNRRLSSYATQVLEASLEFVAERASVAAARWFISGTLETWGYEDLEWAFAQIVGELATNAVLHARTSYTVTLSPVPGRVRLVVRDGSPRPVRPRAYQMDATTGRGLRIVERLSTAWGTHPYANGGKSVWVEIDPTRMDEAELVDEALLDLFDGELEDALGPAADAETQQPSQSFGVRLFACG